MSIEEVTNDIRFHFNDDANVNETTRTIGHRVVNDLNNTIEQIQNLNPENYNKDGIYEQKDNVNPDHYKNSDNDIECIDAIEAALGREGCINFCIGNAIKYLWRWRNKNGVEDLCKAEWYITHARVLEGKK